MKNEGFITKKKDFLKKSLETNIQTNYEGKEKFTPSRMLDDGQR